MQGACHKEENVEYSKILKRAVEITWHHKALWFFGFLLALFSGAGGAGGGQGIQFTMGPGDRLPLGLTLGIVLLVMAFVLVLVVAAVVIANLSRGALIGMVHEIEETGTTSVPSGWRIGWSRFLLLLAIDLITGIPLVMVAMALIAMGLSPLWLLLAQNRALTILAILLAVLFMLLVVGLLIVAGVALSLIRDLAYRQCVVEKKGIVDSIRDGYRMAQQNLRHIGMIWLLLFGIDLAVGIVAAPLFLAIMGVAAVPAAAIFAATESLVSAVLVGILIGIPGFLFLTLLEGVYQAFRSTAWTLTYLELRAQSPRSQA